MIYKGYLLQQTKYVIPLLFMDRKIIKGMHLFSLNLIPCLSSRCSYKPEMFKMLNLIQPIMVKDI